MHQGIFLKWSYGGGIIFDALHRATAELGINSTSAILDKHLDEDQRDPSSFGYMVLHDEKVPFNKAVGDSIGLFPIAYVNRILDLSGKPGYSNASDVKIVDTVANTYIIGYPYRLPDGTFSRHQGWDDEPDRDASFLWGDDQYMGLTLLSRLAKAYDNESLAEFAGTMAVQFAKYMADRRDGLYYHGYNDADRRMSCCKWGRANGWGMMSHVEVLEAMDRFPRLRKSQVFHELVQIFREHALGVVNSQSREDGRWHQVLNETSTFLETSATAMFVSSTIRGIQNSWLDRETFGAMPYLGFAGLQRAITSNGTVTGISTGTGNRHFVRTPNF